VFGHVVNLAARIVKRAQPGEVLTTAEVAKESGLAASAPARHELRGLSGGVDLSVLEGTM
jgi:class 3 adenylate cyclase